MKNELVQSFKIHLKEDGKSVKTVESYVGDTSAFVAFLESKGVDFTGEMKRFYITSKQGNRELYGTIYFLAVQQIQVSKGKKTPRNPVFLEYYNRKVSEGKTKVQELICVMRRLVNIIYGMMKNKIEYVMPTVELKEAV